MGKFTEVKFSGPFRIGRIFLFTLLFSTTGCTTSKMVNYSRGYSDQQVQPLKGDTVFVHGSRSYVAQQKQPQGENARKMPPEMLRPYQPPYYAYKPSPGGYAFLVVTVPFDAATLPFQAAGYGLFSLFINNYHE